MQDSNFGLSFTFHIRSLYKLKQNESFVFCLGRRQASIQLGSNKQQADICIFKGLEKVTNIVESFACKIKLSHLSVNLFSSA